MEAMQEGSAVHPLMVIGTTALKLPLRNTRLRELAVHLDCKMAAQYFFPSLRLNVLLMECWSLPANGSTLSDLTIIYIEKNVPTFSTREVSEAGESTVP